MVRAWPWRARRASNQRLMGSSRRSAQRSTARASWMTKARGLDSVDGTKTLGVQISRDFYRERLRTAHSLDVLTPPAADRELVHRVI